MPTKTRDGLGEIRTVGSKRRAAERRAAELREELNPLILKAVKQGKPVAQIAEAAQLTRQTVYMLLAREGVER